MAQPLWVYGCWENPRTGDCYIIGKDGIRENMTRRWVGFCFLKKYPTLDVWGEPLKPYEFSSFQRHLSFVGPFECDTFLCVDNHVLRIPGENGEILVKRQAPPEKGKTGIGNRALGEWELAETDDFMLEISPSAIKRKTPRGIHESTYSVSEEGYLITDLDIFVVDEYVCASSSIFQYGLLHHFHIRPSCGHAHADSSAGLVKYSDLPVSAR